MAKISKSFRLSVQAQEHLRHLVEQTGSSETAIVELALASFAKYMNGQGPNNLPPEPESPPDYFVERKPQNPQNQGRPNYKKKR